MARCGRCGCWYKYPGDFAEKRYAGKCLWYQIRLEPDQVYDSRECPDFFERIPGKSTKENMEHKVFRLKLREEHIANRIKWSVAVAGFVLTCLAFVVQTFGWFR